MRCLALRHYSLSSSFVVCSVMLGDCSISALFTRCGLKLVTGRPGAAGRAEMRAVVLSCVVMPVDAVFGDERDAFSRWESSEKSLRYRRQGLHVRRIVNEMMAMIREKPNVVLESGPL